MAASVLNVALPDIARSLDVGPARAGWFMLSFLLTVTALLLTAGRLGDLLGHGKTYLLGFALFGLGALWCAVAPTAIMLDAARIAQGVGSALVFASSPALITMSVPPARRGAALGLMSTAIYVGLALGPPVGGILVAHAGWRAIFVAAALAAAIVIVVGVKTVPLSRQSAKTIEFDLMGATVIAAGLLTLLLVCTRGPEWGLMHPATLVTGLATLLLMPGFLWLERRHPTPILDLKLFASAVFTAAAVAALLNYMSLFILLFSLPFALRDGQGMTPEIVGRVLAAQAAGMALFAWSSGALADRIGSRGLAALGMGIVAVGGFGLMASWPTANPWTTGLWMFACGAGTGIFISPNSSALMGAAPKERQGTAGGVMALARNLGMALGVAAGSGLFASVLSERRGPIEWSPAADSVVRLGFGISAGLAFLAGLAALIGPTALKRRLV
jgi:MFS family permease